jgi:hypothetical protein
LHWFEIALPFSVISEERSENVNGLTGLQAAGAANLISRGLVFYDPNTNKPIVWAGPVRVLP